MQASIERYRRAFWNKGTTDRPPVGVAANRTWLPIQYLRAPFPRAELEPEDVSRALARTDYEDSFALRPVRSDDFMPYVAAWRAVPWLEAMCGCPVRYASGSFAPHRSIEHVEDLRSAAVSGDSRWIERLRHVTADLVETAPEDCWVSPTILRGASDVLAAMRGLNNFCLDLYDDPCAVSATAARINKLHAAVLDMHFGMVQPKLGGYGYSYGYWAPGPTTVLQEDALGMCSPAHYRDLFMELTAELVAHVGDYVVFHLHSTGCKYYRHVLDVPGIAGLELTLEQNGPPLSDLVPMLREILERSRLILFVDAFFEQLGLALRQLPRAGLYLVISDKFIPSEDEFRRFAATHWPESF